MKHDSSSHDIRHARRNLTQTQKKKGAEQQKKQPRGSSRRRPQRPTLRPDPMAEFHASIIHDARPRPNVLGEHLIYDRSVQGMIYAFQPKTSMEYEYIALRGRTIVKIRRLERAEDALAGSDMGKRGLDVFVPDWHAAWSAVQQSMYHTPAFVGRRIDDVETMSAVTRQICSAAKYVKMYAAEREAEKQEQAAGSRVQTGTEVAPEEVSQCTDAPQETDRHAAIISLMRLHPAEFDEFTKESLVFSMLYGNRVISEVQKQMWTYLVPMVCKGGRRMTEEFTGPGLSSADRATARQVGLNLKDNPTSLAAIVRLRISLINLDKQLLKSLLELREMSGSPDRRRARRTRRRA